MNDEEKSREFYDKLRGHLEESATWPAPYLYKFIVRSDQGKINTIESIFNHTGAVIKTKESRTGKYTSVSINVIMKNPDEVISKYIEVSEKVEGVISL